MLPIQDRFLTGYNRPQIKLTALKGIVVHWTANLSKGANAERNRLYFNRQGPKSAGDYSSAHYIVDDGSILHAIPDDEMAYHVGAKKYKSLIYTKLGVPKGKSPNHYTIGIEMCVNSDGLIYKTWQNTIELIRYLCHKHGLGRKDVYRHYDITGKDCPYMMLNNDIWNQFLDVVFSDADALPKPYKVTASELNIRKSNSATSPIVGKIVQNEIVYPIGALLPWFQIGIDKWVHSGYLQEM